MEYSSYKLGAALASTLQYRAVQQEADGDVIALTSGLIAAGQKFVGFAMTTGASGDNISVAGSGCKCKAIAGATLTAGTHQLLAVDTVGRVIPWLPGYKAVAVWLPPKSDADDTSAVAAGHQVDVLVLDGADAQSVIRGTATITAASSSVTVAPAQNAALTGLEDADSAGAVVMLTVKGAAPDATALRFSYSVSSDDSDTLTITSNANATADTVVAYAVIL